MTATAHIPVLATEVQQVRSFSLWSRTYDETPNPMLSLEERFLTPLLPPLANKDVLDVGCGTGRWLQQFAAAGAHTLTGIDASPEMLARAKQKLDGTVRLAVGTAASLPMASASTDIAVASFVASYIPDLDSFAREVRRVMRPNGTAFISDVHPGTAAACHWKRSFRADGREVQAPAWAHSLQRVLACFRAAGLTMTCLLEPPFGREEFEILRRAGKLGAFFAAEGLPAIYVLQLRAVESHRRYGPIAQASAGDLTVQASRIALEADTATRGTLEIRDGRIESLSSRESELKIQPAPSNMLSLHGYLLLPGLINAHDHLEFGLYPNLGCGPYANSAEWAQDIHETQRATIAAHQGIPRDVRLWWGAIRNLVCGVTTVCHHNRLHPELLDNDFPVRVISECGWAHSLNLDSEVETKFRSTPQDHPFVLHACEGTDERSAGEILELDRRGTLDERTILVHGLALGGQGIELLNRRGAALVWCPTSNRFLFGRTLTGEGLGAVRKLLLGSDSPLTAAGDLLDEVRVAHREYGITARDLYEMLSHRAASIFSLNHGEGSIRSGSVADLVAVRDQGLSPAETVARLSFSDVELVIVRGRVRLASQEVFRRVPANATEGMLPMEVDGVLRWIRAPLARLFREAQRALGNDVKIGGKRVRHVCTAWL